MSFASDLLQHYQSKLLYNPFLKKRVQQPINQLASLKERNGFLQVVLADEDNVFIRRTQKEVMAQRAESHTVNHYSNPGMR